MVSRVFRAWSTVVGADEQRKQQLKMLGERVRRREVGGWMTVCGGGWVGGDLGCAGCFLLEVPSIARGGAGGG